MNLKNILNNKLKGVFEKLGYDTNLASVSFSDRAELAHFQCNASFSLSKILKDAPINIANKIVENCEDLKDDFELTTCMPGFINIVVKDKLILELLNEFNNNQNCGVEKLANHQDIFIDFGGANIAKPLHVGHLRSPIIGESISRLNKMLGNNVLTDVHLGDWGFQMGLTIAQLMDDYDMSGYFDESKHKFEITLEILDVVYPKASARKKEDQEFNERASQITLDLQSKHKAYFSIWEKIREVSLVSVKDLYSRLDSNFDFWYGESTVNDIVPQIVSSLKNSNCAYMSQGALVVDVTKDDDKKEIPPAIILKSNGAQMYAITDIATIYDRVNNFKNLSQLIYVADARQGLHFEQVFRVIEKSKILNTNPKLTFVGFGTINGKDGKPFKTRDGGTPKLELLLDDIKDKAKLKLDSSFNENEKNQLAEKVSMAAIKFADLSNICYKDYVFDIDKFTAFEGKTGPYLQYTAVRIKSLLNKNDFNAIGNINSMTAEIKSIFINILKLNESYVVSQQENSLHYICNALYDLASAYSTFYNNIKISSQQDAEIKQSHLLLSNLVLKCITQSLDVLGIAVPDKM